MHFVQSMTQKERKPLLLPSQSKNMKEWAQLFFRHQQISIKTTPFTGKLWETRNTPRETSLCFSSLPLFPCTWKNITPNNSFPSYADPRCCQGALPAASQDLVRCRTWDDCSSSHSWWDCGTSAGELRMQAGLGLEHTPPYCCCDCRQRVYVVPERKKKKKLSRRMFSDRWTS